MNRSMLFLAAVALSCGDRQAAFRPIDNVTRSAPGGGPAASYEIRADARSEPHARVNVWSNGVYEDDDRTWAWIGVELRNLGERTIALDLNDIRIEAYLNDGRLLPPGRLVEAIGPTHVPAGEAAIRELVYELPRVAPDQIGNLRVRWAVEHEDGQRYVQFTDFQRVREQYVSGIYYYDPIFGYYDPFLYGPPYAYHLHYRVPVGRVIISHRSR